MASSEEPDDTVTLTSSDMLPKGRGVHPSFAVTVTDPGSSQGAPNHAESWRLTIRAP